jgi:hypothetical protein
MYVLLKNVLFFNTDWRLFGGDQIAMSYHSHYTKNSLQDAPWRERQYSVTLRLMFATTL